MRWVGRIDRVHLDEWDKLDEISSFDPVLRDETNLYLLKLISDLRKREGGDAGGMEYSIVIEDLS